MLRYYKHQGQIKYAYIFDSVSKAVFIIRAKNKLIRLKLSFDPTSNTFPTNFFVANLDPDVF